MTLRTVTYDTATHKIVPVKPTIEWQANLADIQDCVSFETIKNVIAAATEYQEPTKDE